MDWNEEAPKVIFSGSSTSAGARGSEIGYVPDKAASCPASLCEGNRKKRSIHV